MPLFNRLVWRFIIINLFWVGKLNATPSPEVDCADYWELSYAHPYLDRADSFRESEEYDRALILYQLAVEKFTSEQNWEGLLKARNLVSDILRTKFQYDTALTILVDNIKIVQEYLNNDPAELATIYFIRAVNYDWQRKYDLALESFNQALDLRKDLYGEINLDVALTYSAIGEMYLYRQQYLNARGYLTKATEIIDQLNCQNLPKTGNSFYYLASAHRELRDFEKAKIYGLKALTVHQNSTVNDQTRCYNLLGNLNNNMGNYSQSIKYNLKAIGLLFEQRPLSATQKRDLANYYNSVAINYIEIEQFDSAQYYFQKSLGIYRLLPGTEPAISMCLQNMGVNYHRQGKYDSAQILLSQAVTQRKRIYGDKNSFTSSSLGSLGDLMESQGKLDSALTFFQQAIIAGSGAGFANVHTDQNPAPVAFTYDGRLLDALWAKARVFIKIYRQDSIQKNLDLSLNTLLVALELMDKNQEIYQLDGSTLLMARDFYGVFETALHVCHELYQITADPRYLNTAFLVMEKSKARLLFDTFNDLYTNRLIGIPDSLIQLENRLKARLDSSNRVLENKVALGESSIGLQEMEDQVFKATVELEGFYQMLSEQYPSYTTTVKRELIQLNAIQHNLADDNSTLLDYFWGDSTLFTLVVKPNEVKFYQQPMAQVVNLVSNYQKHLVDGPQFSEQKARLTDFSNTAFSLNKYLLKGINFDDGPIIIAADGPLRFIPFEALVVEKPEVNLRNYHQLKYLLNDHSVSYVYSANMWSMLPQESKGSLETLGFSYSSEGSGENEVSGALPGTAKEIEILQSKLNGYFLTGPKATKAAFLNQAKTFDILHLAVHGISDSVSHLNNRLLFRNSEHPDQSEPLYTYELYDLQLSSRLAVLSACESGLGKNYQGEGVYSMSRAFSYAGCPTTVMSLWRISDRTTPEILERFYDEVIKGQPIDQALRSAKLKYLSENPGTMAHPGLWSAMVVHGQVNPITAKSTNPIWWLVIAIVGLISWLYIRQRIKP